jgi:hypothetical protein
MSSSRSRIQRRARVVAIMALKARKTIYKRSFKKPGIKLLEKMLTYEFPNFYFK